VVINLGTWWGIHRDALPRTSFQAILPYLLAFGMKYRNSLNRWPALMAFAGLAVYFHAPGALVWAPALWLGFWGFLPRDRSWTVKLGYLLFLGLLFLVFFTPFALNYLQTRDAEVDPAILGAAREIFRQRLSPGFLNIGVALAGVLTPAMRGLLAAGGCAAFLLHRHAPEDRPKLRLYGLWTLGVFLTSVVVPSLDQAAAHFRGTFPIQIDLVRGLRFFVPLSIILLVWGLARLAEARQAYRPWIVALLCLVVLAGFGEFLSKSTRDQRSGHLLSFSPEKREVLDMLNAVMDHVPQGAAILPVGFDPLPVRYYALRPVVHAWKDAGHLGMTNPARLTAWRDTELRLQEIKNMEPGERLPAFLDLAGSLEAGYLLLDRSLFDNSEPLKQPVEFQNAHYILLRVEG